MNEEIKDQAETNTATENDLVVTKKNNTVFGVGGVGSLALVGLVLIVILTVLIVRSQNNEEDILSFAPADSFYAFEVENIEGAADVFASAPVWRGNELTKDGIIQEFSKMFGSDSDILEKFVGNITSVTFIESFVNKTPQKMLVFNVGNGWDIERYYKREYSKVATPVKFASSMNGLEITRPDKSVFYLKKIANFVLLSENKDLILRSLSAYKEDELSLAQCNVRFGDGEDGMPRIRLYVAINSFFMNYPEYKGLIPEKMNNAIAGDSAFLYEATLNATGFVAEGKFVKNEAAGYASGVNAGTKTGRGFFGTVFWVIFIIILILIAIPVLFVIFTLLLALYFFLLAWWKGELVPIDPPLKDLSNNLKEDLGVTKVKEEPVSAAASESTDSANDNPTNSSENGDKEQ